MIRKLLALPLRAAKVALRFVRGSGQPKSDGPLPYTPAAGGFKRPPEAVHAAEEDDDHGHHHDHGHSHSHGHEHEPAPAPAPKAGAPKADAPKAEGKPKAARKGKTAASKPQVDVHAEQTPNPNARKFTVVGKQVVEKGSLSFNSKAEAEASPLGSALFLVVGVRSIFAVKDFVTVTKEDNADWDYLESAVINAIQSAF